MSLESVLLCGFHVFFIGQTDKALARNPWEQRRAFVITGAISISCPAWPRPQESYSRASEELGKGQFQRCLECTV